MEKLTKLFKSTFLNLSHVMCELQRACHDGLSYRMYKTKNVGAVWVVVTPEFHLKIHTQV